jgi:hypothetical protein
MEDGDEIDAMVEQHGGYRLWYASLWFPLILLVKLRWDICLIGNK